MLLTGIKVIAIASCVMCAHAHANETSEPLPKSRVIREISGSKTLENKMFGIGVFRESIGGKNSYDPSGLGFSASFSQNLSSNWRGNIAVQSNEWQSDERRVAPVTVVSSVHWYPPTIFSEVKNWFQPYAGMGLGYLVFLKSRGLPFKRAETESPQVLVNGTLGFIVPTPYNFGIRTSWDVWSGVKNARYKGRSLSLHFVFGDLSK